MASLCAWGIITPALALMQPFSAKSIRRNKFLRVPIYYTWVERDNIVDKMPCLGAYAPSGIRTHELLITSREHEPLHHIAPTLKPMLQCKCSYGHEVACTTHVNYISINCRLQLEAWDFRGLQGLRVDQYYESEVSQDTWIFILLKVFKVKSQKVCKIDSNRYNILCFISIPQIFFSYICILCIHIIKLMSSNLFWYEWQIEYNALMFIIKGWLTPSLIFWTWANWKRNVIDREKKDLLLISILIPTPLFITRV